MMILWIIFGGQGLKAQNGNIFWQVGRSKPRLVLTVKTALVNTL